MPYTLGQAAKECGRSKPTLLSAINKGRLAANRNERGEWQIDPDELERVYPPKGKTTVREAKPLTAEEAVKIKLLEEKIKLLEQVVSDLQEDKKAARADVLQWQGVAAHLSEQLKQLPAPRHEEKAVTIIDTEPEPEPEPAQKAAGGQKWPWPFCYWAYFFRGRG